ncbi:hypothetical protein FO440_15025 [Mucilaginibacter corticis]|uniref:Uncharacterized protein n=1 Tax=Mucilaginibacter corticis TaxID=2597670 RepID=A0A556MM83_9SPHI|nr:hypothetical protein [Mucilaginibacter corticis]TSJ41044.1 hypothetical protein FO440_15025 [Mucilaginibacter corticis]
MKAKLFSYKVEGIVLEEQDRHLKLSPEFDRKQVLAPLKERFEAENYKIDEASLSFKLVDDQLYIQGLAKENDEPKTVGFRFGN